MIYGNIPLYEWSTKTNDSICHVNYEEEKEFKTPENLTTWVFEDGTFIPMVKILGKLGVNTSVKEADNAVKFDNLKKACQ